MSQNDKRPPKDERKNGVPPQIATMDDIAELKATIANLVQMVAQQNNAAKAHPDEVHGEAMAKIDDYAEMARRLEKKLEVLESPSVGDTIKMADELGAAQERKHIVDFINQPANIWEVFCESKRGMVILKKETKKWDSHGDMVDMKGAIILEIKPYNGVGSEIPHPSKPRHRMLEWGQVDMRKHPRIGPGKDVSYEEAFELLCRAPLYRAGYYMNGDVMRTKLRGIYQLRWMTQQIYEANAKQIAGMTTHQIKAGHFGPSGALMKATTPRDNVLEQLAAGTAPAGSIAVAVPDVPDDGPTIQSDHREIVTARPDIHPRPASGADDLGLGGE